MARSRKPTALALLTGNDKANPARWRRQGRDKEPESLGPLSPVPPEYMTEQQAEAYTEVVSRCHKDVLCVADQMVVEMVACLIAEYRTSPDDMSVNKIGKLFTGLDKLGMSPASRSKVQAMKRDGKEKDPLDEFAA